MIARLCFSISGMSFQRSYSKVWWGSEQSSLTSGGFYSGFSGGSSTSSTSNYPQRQPASLGPLGNLSCIQEVEDEQNSSKLSWHKHDSPGSLRSQVSISMVSHLIPRTDWGISIWPAVALTLWSFYYYYSRVMLCNGVEPNVYTSNENLIICAAYNLVMRYAE